MSKEHLTFGRWLTFQLKRDDPIGDLARYAEWDIAAPLGAKTMDRWLGYLEYRKADLAISGMAEIVRNGLHFGWSEWLRGERFPQPETSQWCIAHLDREYAFEKGDPVLAVVTAVDQREALVEAGKLGLNAPSGLWAYARKVDNG